jgi:predicted alpha/beta superfamily hydrolase
MGRSIAVAVGAVLAFAVQTTARAEPFKVLTESPPAPTGYKGYVIHSDRVGRDFVVSVATSGAVVFLPGQKLPAIYALDGGYGMAGPQGVMLGQASAMEPAIVVSVGYLPGQTALRSTDLMHSRTVASDGTAMGGGGAAFEAFLLQDLKPFIEAHYPADPRRSVLFGHSAGGLFAANVFADKPDAFYGYIIGSPSAWADPTLFARVSAAAAKAHGKHVYLSVGEKEGAGKPGGGTTMLDGYNALLKALKGHPGVTLTARIYKGETHASYYTRLVTDGFETVLPPGMPLGADQAKLPAAALAKYVGDYRLPDGRTFAIAVDKDGGMYGRVAGLFSIPMWQNGPDRFYAAVADANITFDATGATISGVDGGTLRAEREKAAN